MSRESGIGSISKHFSIVEDLRIDRIKRHGMLYIIIIPICGVICGVDSWVDIELSGKTKIEWLKSLLKLPNGIPSHDTHLRGRLLRKTRRNLRSAAWSGFRRSIT